MRILIAVPTFENVTPDTFKALWDMDKGGHDCEFEFVRGYDCATARNRMAQMTIDGGYDRLLMVDSDVTLPRHALACLMEHDVDFVSGFYLHRNADNRPSDSTCVCRLRDSVGTLYYNYPLESEYTVAELAEMRDRGEHLVEIHGCGMGCAMVKADALRRLKYPWFDWVNYRDDHRGMLSEDLYFCEELRKAGIPRHVDTRVACGHLFRRLVKPE